MNELLVLTNELNEYAKSYKGPNEIISKEDIILATYYINNLYIKDTSDVLLFLSSLNLYNAYAKQQATHEIYRFKKNITTLINIISKINVTNLKVCETKDSGNLYIFCIGNIQFSFHDEKKCEIPINYYQEMKWDGIRKQPCAKTIFNKIIDNSLTKNATTMEGENIHQKSSELLKEYHNKEIPLATITNY